MSMTAICVFCGSSRGASFEYAAAAERLGKVLSEQQINLVYGGSNVGLMGITAKKVLQGGMHVTGVITEAINARVAALEETELHVVKTMHERKAMMAELCEGFIALPGGIGTLEELTEVFTWSQLGIHSKPLGLLNTRGYYDPFTAFLEHMVKEGFLRKEHLDTLLIDEDPEKLLDKMQKFRYAYQSKWNN